MGRGLCSDPQERFHDRYPVAARHPPAERRNRNSRYLGCRALTGIRGRVDQRRGDRRSGFLKMVSRRQLRNKACCRMDRQATGKTGVYDRERDAAALRTSDWPRAARLDAGVRREVRISSFPAWQSSEASARVSAISAPTLSPRATAGFLSRIEKSSLRFAPGFKDRVRAHLQHVRAIDRLVCCEPTKLIAAE